MLTYLKKEPRSRPQIVQLLEAFEEDYGQEAKKTKKILKWKKIKQGE